MRLKTEQTNMIFVTLLAAANHYLCTDMGFLKVSDFSGASEALEIPEGISLNLMELLKACEYPVAGTCGGMGICGSCHINVLKGQDQLPEMGDQESETLDTLPVISVSSRLACQIQVSPALDGLEIQIMEPA
ncbi:MAG: 2Fe-2S iron-sulfur cluster-binding protein [Chitinophagales bacterium]|nr:2Fe-2S iron-sulfur cluster-binding protein [Chitinophagales bacterium]